MGDVDVQHWTDEDGESYNAVGCTDVAAFTAAVIAQLETDQWDYHLQTRPAVGQLAECHSCADGLGYNTYWHDPSIDVDCNLGRVESIAYVEVVGCDCPRDASVEELRSAALAVLDVQVASG